VSFGQSRCHLINVRNSLRYSNNSNAGPTRLVYHVAKDLAVPHNITLVPLPPYAPELNPIENVWEYLRGNELAITVFDSYDDILDKACDAWTFFANDQNRIASIITRSWATVIL
jgi:transposase